MPSTIAVEVAGGRGLGDVGAEAVRAAASCRPRLPTSATMLAFHEPPAAVIAPVT